MRELELKEKKIKEIQSTGDRLLREDHPARPTVEVGDAGGPPCARRGDGRLWGAPGCPRWGDAGEPLIAHDGGDMGDLLGAHSGGMRGSPWVPMMGVGGI